MKLQGCIQINEVGLRDGLQLEDRILSVEQKIKLVDALIDANVKTIEFGSFVHPKLVPQMKNSRELYELISEKHQDIDFIALIPNLKGVILAAEVGVQRVNTVLSASNTHNLQNVRKTKRQSLEEFLRIKEYCEEKEILLDCSIATTFGCPFEGDIHEEVIFSIIESVIQAGVNVITLADTTGMANPKQVYDLSKNVLEKWPNQPFNLHFHNTRGMGLANVLGGIQAGISSFDASLGGLGGCPFAPGATGNICTEDVVHMLEEMQLKTDISLDDLLEASKMLRSILDHELPGQILKSGKSSRLYPVPAI
ncbi:hydroxymethylglutaryl-CoA lyase [Peribacillus sp. ACCC06369]|uniref:hydroxymethylglutaryl-CoA lyase n=1 Tax=Peribacillus sp. ACCC06369 TaxID=3055860 RepID=UPI0025A0623B|nr:hydroxymethylglutaryl-CoA lyase [Peribacillus sp. ACCC06369]MDM5358441.1 hydroxymethylglutaryl-CoA lyase [Peribacillus sp. ACCC06369]